MRSRRVPDVGLALFLAVIAAAMYQKITRLWWMFDDPFHFNVLKNISLGGTLHDYALYNALGTPLFTPVLMLSLKWDLQTFGVTPRPFYIHQLILVLLLPAAEYLMLRLWCSRPVAAATALVTILAGPALSVFPVLMLRHYVGGAALAMIATWLYVRALRSPNAATALAICSGVVYFIAASTKEIYVPLPAVLLVIPEGSWRERIRALVPQAFGAVGYAIWRIAVIGPNVGSYGFVARPGGRFGRMASLPFRAIAQFSGSGSAAGRALMIAVVVCALLLLFRLRGARVPLIVAIAVALGPILPVATELQPRWAFAMWLVFSIAIAFVPRAIPRGQYIVYAVLVVAIAAHAIEWPRAMRHFRRMSDEGRVFVTLKPDEAMRNAETPPVTLGELARLFGSGGHAIYDDFDACANSPVFRRVLQYDARSRWFTDVGPRTITSSCTTIREMPLNVDITFDEPGSLFWHLGPYMNGQYAFILGHGALAYDVHEDGGFRSPGMAGLVARIRYQSPAGWTTYSPELNIDMRARRRITFARR